MSRWNSNLLESLIFLCLMFSGAFAFGSELVGIDTEIFEFQESESATPNPDRGMFDQVLVKNSLRLPALSNDYKNHRVYFLLDEYLDRPLASQDLIQLEEGLQKVASAEHRLVLRFFYDWPSPDVVASGLKSRRARTASFSMMARHIQQLSPVLKRNSKAIFAVESGMIGFWGEQHGDTPEKQNSAVISSIVDLWRSELKGTSIQVLARYPKALGAHVGRHPEMLVEQPRFGYWNDCLGAHDDDNMRPVTAAIMLGETCGLAPRYDYSCNTMIAYFKAARLSLLHAHYFQPTISQWRENGCLFEIQKQLGYRYVIREMKFIAEKMLLELRVDNVGWGGSHISRPLYLVSNGQRLMKIADLADFHPGSINIIRVSLPQVVEIKNGLSLETDDRVQFSNKTGNFLVRYPVISQ